jgi:hypothetical protein
MLLASAGARSVSSWLTIDKFISTRHPIPTR